MARDLPKPFLKWAGGKRQLMHQLIELAPRDFRNFHEPFLGGGAMFFELSKTGRLAGSGRAFLSDLNRELVATYKAIARDPEAVISELKRWPYDSGTYYAVRELDPWEDCDEAQRAARMIYLNRTGFNGMYRVNADGHFNVPFGRYSNPTICDEENLRAVCEALVGVSLKCQNFDEVIAHAEPGDFVYFDPPYVPVSKTADFTAFTAGGFGMSDQYALAEVFEELVDRGVFCALSNSDVPWVRERYAGFQTWTLQARRNINSKADKRGPVSELVITGPLE